MNTKRKYAVNPVEVREKYIQLRKKGTAADDAAKECGFETPERLYRFCDYHHAPIGNETINAGKYSGVNFDEVRRKYKELTSAGIRRENAAKECGFASLQTMYNAFNRHGFILSEKTAAVGKDNNTIKKEATKQLEVQKEQRPQRSLEEIAEDLDNISRVCGVTVVATFLREESRIFDEIEINIQTSPIPEHVKLFGLYGEKKSI